MTDGAAPAAAPMTTALTALPVKPKPALPKVTPPSHCHLCGQAVYTTERVPAGGKYYHRRCVRCCVCGVNLSGVHFSWIAYEGSLFCADDVPAKPMRTRVMKSTGWAARSYFDRLSGMSDLMLYIILMLRPPFASFTSQSSYFERYVAWGKQLMALKHANRCFCTPLAKWNNCGVADYAAFLVAKERGAENLLNGRSSGWAQVLASGELDRWEFAEARTLSLAGNDVRSSLFAYANMQVHFDFLDTLTSL